LSEMEYAPSYAIRNWVAQFKCGDFCTCDVPRPGRLNAVTTLEIIDQIHELILEDHQILAKSIAEQLGISCEQVGCIIHKDLDMWKPSTKWVPKCLNAYQKHQRCHSFEQLLEFFQCDPNDFQSRLVTLGETWLYHYDPETKQESLKWWHSGSPCIFLIDYLPKGQTINVEFYSSLLVELKDILKEKCCGKVTKGVLFLHDNTLPHWALATQKKLAYLGFQCLDHPPYSLDLALSDYHLCPELGGKKKRERD